MNQNVQFADMLAERLTMYRFLARLYTSEADAGLLDALKETPLNDGEDDASEGFALMAGWLREPGTDDPVEALAVDYAHTFLGAGIAEGLVAYPFESVYTSAGRLVMQDAWEDVCRYYREHGLGRADDTDTLEDQIGLECAFVAHLIGESQKALEADDEKALEASLMTQHEFIQKHLVNWVGRFAEDVKQTALTDFYRGLAAVTADFIAADAETMKAFADEAAA